MIAMDGSAGYVVADPDAHTIAELESMSQAAAEREALEAYNVEASTRDGRRIEVAANLGSANEAEEALSWGQKERALPHRVPVYAETAASVGGRAVRSPHPEG
jgi:phosphoenolpyruvate-protein kinase (PTS system EI component)